MITCTLITTTKALHSTEKQGKVNQLPDKSTCITAMGRKMCHGCCISKGDTSPEQREDVK